MLPTRPSLVSRGAGGKRRRLTRVERGTVRPKRTASDYLLVTSPRLGWYIVLVVTTRPFQLGLGTKTWWKSHFPSEWDTSATESSVHWQHHRQCGGSGRWRDRQSIAIDTLCVPFPLAALTSSGVTAAFPLVSRLWWRGEGEIIHSPFDLMVVIGNTPPLSCRLWQERCAPPLVGIIRLLLPLWSE